MKLNSIAANINTELSNSQEVVSLHIGQAGCQIASSQWEVFCNEHAILSDGTVQASTETDSADANRHVFFTPNPDQSFTSRSLLIDLDPSVPDEIKSGPYRDLFHPDHYICDNIGDASSNFARGYYGIGTGICSRVSEQVRQIVECCDGPVTFFITRALGGGTGGGTGSLIFENISDDFNKIIKFETAVMASNHLSTSPLEPYNTLMSLESCSIYGDCTCLVDNESIYRILCSIVHDTAITYTQVNRIIAQAISGMFASIRFPGYINGDLTSILTNLIPYPRIHFPMVNYCPLVSKEGQRKIKCDTENITKGCFSKLSSLLGISPNSGKHVSCCMIFRGETCHDQLFRTITKIKADPKIKFVDWTPTGFKVTHSFMPTCNFPNWSLASSPLSVCMLSNNSVMTHIFRVQSYLFETLYKQNAFVHWFVGEGMDCIEFEDALENTKSLERDYADIDHLESEKETKKRKMSNRVSIETIVGVFDRMRRTPEEERDFETECEEDLIFSDKVKVKSTSSDLLPGSLDYYLDSEESSDYYN